MNLQMIFRVNGVILFINGLNFLLNTKMFLGMAGFDMTPQLLTLAQAMGVSIISIGLLSWRTPDIAGEGKSNPIACILSFAMALRYSFDEGKEADRLEAAVESVLADGYRTADLLGEEGVDPVTTQQMGDAILVALNSTL